MADSHFDVFLDAVKKSPDADDIFGFNPLVVPPAECWVEYWCEPLNVLTFAHMGVDGVHFALVKIDGRVRDDSPVIQISPMDFSEPYTVLAATFLDYLADICGVERSEMEKVIEEQRAGTDVLVSFIKGHSGVSEYGEMRDRRLDKYLELIQTRPI
jgi:hypothetical protein